MIKDPQLKNKKIHIVACDYGEDGIAFLETNPEKAEFEDIKEIKKLYDQHQKPLSILKIIQIDFGALQASDVTDEFFMQYPDVKKAETTTPNNKAYLNLCDSLDLYFIFYDLGDGEYCFTYSNPIQETKETIIKLLEDGFFERPVSIIQVNLKTGKVNDISSDIAIDWFKIHRDQHELELYYLKDKEPDDLPKFIMKHHPEAEKLPTLFDHIKKLKP